jgi:hypothetical protein
MIGYKSGKFTREFYGGKITDKEDPYCCFYREIVSVSVCRYLGVEKFKIQFGRLIEKENIRRNAKLYY